MPETAWKFYLRPADAWEAMYADCAAARESIDIEQFIFGLDELGEKFFELFRKKNKEGVKVRIICDAVGSFDFLNSAMENKLKAEGIKIKFFNPIKPWRIGNFSSWALRDHRKLLIVDGRVGHTGGVGLEKKMENWRDTNVRVTGPVVSEMRAVFGKMWAAPPKRKFFRFKPSPDIVGQFSFLTNSPSFRGRYIYHDLRRAIRGANRYIHITTPYFVPSIRLFRALIKAAKRGVDVKLLVPQASDVRIADIAGGSYFIPALKAGIKIYLYDSDRILHTKAGIIDDIWGTVGSANLDNLSLLLNFEGNIRSSDGSFIAELKDQFEKDIASSKVLTQEAWAHRPFFRKLLEVVSWPVHGLL